MTVATATNIAAVTRPSGYQRLNNFRLYTACDRRDQSFVFFLLCNILCRQAILDHRLGVFLNRVKQGTGLRSLILGQAPCGDGNVASRYCCCEKKGCAEMFSN